MSLSHMIGTHARSMRMAATKRADDQLFASDTADEYSARVLPVDAARDSARRQDTVRMRPLSKRERGAFLVEFGWLRMELAK